MRRQRSRLGLPKAITALVHRLVRIFYAMMTKGEAYVKKTEADYEEQVRDRLEKQLRRRAEQLGFEVLKKADPTSDSVPSVEG